MEESCPACGFKNKSKEIKIAYICRLVPPEMTYQCVNCIHINRTTDKEFVEEVFLFNNNVFEKHI